MKMKKAREKYRRLKKSLTKENLQRKYKTLRKNLTKKNIRRKYNQGLERLKIMLLIFKRDNAHIHRGIPDPFTFYNWRTVDSSDQVRLKISQDFISEQVQRREIIPETITPELRFYKDLEIDCIDLTEILIKLDFLFYIPRDGVDTDDIVTVKDLLDRLELKSMYDEEIYFSPRMKAIKEKFEDSKLDKESEN